MKLQHAYTFLEALIVLFIISILAALSFPSLHSFFNREYDKTIQLQLLRSIQLARQEAIAQHVLVSLCKSKNGLTCSGDWSDGYLVFNDENKDGIVHDKKQILAVIQQDSQKGTLHLRSYPHYLDYLQFLPTGFMRSHNNGTFWYCHEGEVSPVWAIAFSQSGKARVDYPDKKGIIYDSQGKPFECFN